MWHVRRPGTHVLSPKRLYQVLSIGGQVLVVLAIIVHSGLFAAAGLLVPVGVRALLVLAVLIFCVGLLDSDKAVRLDWVWRVSGWRWCGVNGCRDKNWDIADLVWWGDAGFHFRVIITPVLFKYTYPLHIGQCFINTFGWEMKLCFYLRDSPLSIDHRKYCA
jgi:hypothetical protein